MQSGRSILIGILAGLVMVCAGISRAGEVCYAPPNADGSADLPPAFCRYDPDPMWVVLGFQVAGAIDSFFDITYQVGGNFGPEGQIQQYRAVLHLELTGTGTLGGYARTLAIPIDVETHSAPRGTGGVQSFDTEMVSLFGQLPPGDPDFDLLRVTAGTNWGMPSPGHTTLTQVGGPDSEWTVDSFFDIFYRIEMEAHAGGPLDGVSGTAEGSIRFSVGETPPPPSPPVDYFGLPHSALGGATLTPDAFGLTLGGLGSICEGGVEIDLGAADGFQCDIEPIDWQPGGHITVRRAGGAGSGTVTFCADDGSEGFFFEGGDDNTVHAGTRTRDVDTPVFLSLLLGNTIVATAETVLAATHPPQDVHIYRVHAAPRDIVAMRILIADNGVKPGSVNKSGGDKMNKAELIEAIAKLSPRGGGPVPVSLLDGPPVLADTLSMTFSKEEGSDAGIEKVTVRGWDPGRRLGLRITDEAGIWFGNAHRSLTATGDLSVAGGARLHGGQRTIGAGQVTEILKIAPPTGGNTGGVAIAPADPEAVGFEMQLHTRPAGEWGIVEEIEFVVERVERGKTGQCTVRVRFAPTLTGGVQLYLETDDATCLPESIGVDVLRNGRRIATGVINVGGLGAVLLAEGDFGDVGGEPMTLRVINEEGVKPPPTNKPKKKDVGNSTPWLFEVGLAGPVPIAVPGLAPVMGDLLKVWLSPTPHRTPVSGVQLFVTTQDESHWSKVVWESPFIPYPDFPTTHHGGTFKTGADVCLESPTAGLNYQWFKDGEPVTTSFGPRLCLENLQPSDSGVYRVLVEDGAKGLVEHFFYITVANSVPAAGAFGLAMLAALAGAGGLATLRRRRRT